MSNIPHVVSTPQPIILPPDFDKDIAAAQNRPTTWLELSTAEWMKEVHQNQRIRALLRAHNHFRNPVYVQTYKKIVLDPLHELLDGYLLHYHTSGHKDRHDGGALLKFVQEAHATEIQALVKKVETDIGDWTLEYLIEHQAAQTQILEDYRLGKVHHPKP